MRHRGRCESVRWSFGKLWLDSVKCQRPARLQLELLFLNMPSGSEWRTLNGLVLIQRLSSLHGRSKRLTDTPIQTLVAEAALHSPSARPGFLTIHTLSHQAVWGSVSSFIHSLSYPLCTFNSVTGLAYPSAHKAETGHQPIPFTLIPWDNLVSSQLKHAWF